MENSHRFFNNRACRYFPCHKTDRPEEFNCLFCFCPLYFLEDCGGNHRTLENGIKDCTPCLIPHHPKGYDHIMRRLKAEFEKVREAPEKDG